MNRTICATLIDVYHMTIEEISLLTDWQIREIFFHARKKTGEIEKKDIEKPKRKKKSLKDYKIESDPNVPVRSMRNPRYKEYFDAFTSLTNMYSLQAITEENFLSSRKALQEKFTDLFQGEQIKEEPIKEEKEDYQTNYNILNAHYMNGILSKEQFDVAVEKLKTL